MKILICDDHAIVRDGIRRILSEIDEIKLFKEAGDANELFNILSVENFDILLLDISLPDKSGLEILESLKIKYPSLKVLILSSHSQEQYEIRSLKLGASGYITKSNTSDELIGAIKKISLGGKIVSESLAENMALHIGKYFFQNKHELLSSREFEIMIKLANGKHLQEIGDELFISNKTVGTYRSRILKKINLKNNIELAKYCIENNLI